MDIEKIDDELYKSIYGLPKVGDYKKIWNKIKSNPNILREAVKVKRDKFNKKYIVNGLTISESLLIDYENVDKEAYNELIKTIYSNKDVARIVMDGASNGGYSYLLMSLWNKNLKLTEEQKAFALNEAMNKIGTTRWKQSEINFSKKISDMGLSDEKTTYINIDGCINPIGEKLGAKYLNYIFSTLSNTQAHGVGEFDIRYHILNNPNWSIEEKKKIVMDFWYDNETYEDYLEQWEWGIINAYSSNSTNTLEKEYLYDYSYQELLNYYGNKNITDRIWNEIKFCKQMHELRPLQRELEYSKKKVL